MLSLGPAPSAASPAAAGAAARASTAPSLAGTAAAAREPERASAGVAGALADGRWWGAGEARGERLGGTPASGANGEAGCAGSWAVAVPACWATAAASGIEGQAAASPPSDAPAVAGGEAASGEGRAGDSGGSSTAVAGRAGADTAAGGIAPTTASSCLAAASRANSRWQSSSHCSSERCSTSEQMVPSRLGPMPCSVSLRSSRGRAGGQLGMPADTRQLATSGSRTQTSMARRLPQR